ncbi:MAG: hypothetical protein GXX91_00890 [Verrucomicrobiaceae bacterium]|nr:hypothetical protein [Verrucomicrobiaceae bacterium]
MGICLGVIFVVGNAFAARSVLKVLRGSDAKIATLRSTLADHEMWVEETPKAAARETWLAETMPPLGGASMGKLQGELIQSLQDDLFERKLRIERQSLQDIVNSAFYTEVSVRLEVKGAESAVLEWLTTLQGPEKFQVIKSLELELDNRSKEIEPQAECEITIARWYHPESGEPLTSQEVASATKASLLGNNRDPAPAQGTGLF